VSLSLSKCMLDIARARVDDGARVNAKIKQKNTKFIIEFAITQ